VLLRNDDTNTSYVLKSDMDRCSPVDAVIIGPKKLALMIIGGCWQYYLRLCDLIETMRDGNWETKEEGEGACFRCQRLVVMLLYKGKLDLSATSLYIACDLFHHCLYLP